MIHAGLEYEGSLQAGLFQTVLADGSRQPELLPSTGKYTRPHLVCHILVGRKWCMLSPCQEWWSNITERGKTWNPGIATPYDPDYDRYLIDFGISLFSRGPKPENWQELKTRLARRRSSLSRSQFSKGDFETSVQNNSMAETEAEAMANVSRIFKGNSAIFSSQKRIFNNLEPLDSKLAAAMPDSYDGSLPADLHLYMRNDPGD